jgi:hypothetical protein
MIHIRVVYQTFGLQCGYTKWIREAELNKWLAFRQIPYDAWIWIDKGDRYDRYLGYENQQIHLTA